MLLKGISVADEKPNLNLFLHPIVRQLKRLEYGIDVDLNGVYKNIKFFLLNAIFDKPAKTAVLNMIGSNGFYGCTKCLQPGVSYRSGEGSKLIVD